MKVLKVEVVTPVHNRREETLRCLRSLQAVETTGLRLHTIVVDDGSSDGTSEAVAAQFPEVEIVKGDGSLWYTAGTNRGITAALKHDPDYVLAINDDSIFDKNCIVNLVKCAERHARSVVGSLLLDRTVPHRVFQVAPRWELHRGGYRHWFHQTVWTVPAKPFEVELIVGNCVLYPAAAIREVGLMDEKRLVQYGDAEYTPRMRRHGWRLLIEPAARTFCKPNDVLTGFRRLPTATKLRQLLEPTAPHSIQRRVFISLGGAPSVWQGLLSIPIYYARILLGRSADGPWAVEQKEEALSATFASAIVDDQ
jgi:GT2 family glycosyltransferase